MSDEEEVAFDWTTVTVAEAELLEQWCDGKPYNKIVRSVMLGSASIAELKAVGAMVKRRTDPDFTPDDIPGDTLVKGVLDAN